LLQVKNLATSFEIEGRWFQVLKGVSFEVAQGQTLGIIGESGSGKSVTSLSLMRLIPKPWGRIDSGEVWLEGRELLSLSPQAFRLVRGREMAMVFQDPMTSLNPVLTIGAQLQESLAWKAGANGDQRRTLAENLLREVGITDPAQRLESYPHELSGGMKQRVMIAMAIAAEPKLLIADEPTTALDVTIQAQILALLKELQQKHKMALILITHDLGVVSQTCNQVAVMYGGTLVEKAPTRTLFANPRHPYSFGLIKSIQSLTWPQGNRLYTIPGQVPGLGQFGSGCVFVGRCDRAQERCKTQVPPMTQTAPEREVACFYPLGGQT